MAARTEFISLKEAFTRNLRSQHLGAIGMRPVARDDDGLERIERKISRKPHNRVQHRDPTPKQLEAVQLYNAHEGNVSAAAKALGISRAAFIQRYEAGLRNYGVSLSMLRPKIKSYGDVHVADDDEGPAASPLKSRAKVNKKRR